MISRVTKQMATELAIFLWGGSEHILTQFLDITNLYVWHCLPAFSHDLSMIVRLLLLSVHDYIGYDSCQPI